MKNWQLSIQDGLKYKFKLLLGFYGERKQLIGNRSRKFLAKDYLVAKCTEDQSNHKGF